MQTIANDGLMLAVFSLGGGEILLVLALVLILFGAKKLPDLARGLGQGISSFRKATIETMDDEASEAGRSVGGIYGKPAAQALTPDNQVAELYSHAAFAAERKPPRTRQPLGKLLKNLWHRVLRFLAIR